MRYFLVLALVACAPQTPSTDPEPTQRTILTDDRMYQTTVLANARTNVAADKMKTFAAVEQTLSDLGIETTTMDPTSGRIGNTNFIRSRQLAKTALSRFLDCGSTQTGPRADSYRLYLSLLVTLRPGANNTTDMETAFRGSAQTVEGASLDKIECGSTGVLEERIRKTVLLKLGMAK
jgi:hypothetical protein